MYRSRDDALLVRLAAFRPDQFGPWPELTGPDAPDVWLPWLEATLRVPGFGAALGHASPDLAGRLGAAVRGELAQPDLRRVVLAVLRYRLRATTRSTPYGLFAGVAPATADRVGNIRLGTRHHPVARVHAAWLSRMLDELEADPLLRPYLMVRVNNLVMQRDTHLVLEHRASHIPRGAPVHLRIRIIRLVRAAVTLAAEPIRYRDLANGIAAECGVRRSGAERLIGQLVSQRVLLTHLRPPATASDPLADVVRALEELGVDGAPVGAAVARLRDARDQQTRSAAALDAAAPVPAAPVATAGSNAPPVQVDLRMDCDLVLPRSVTAEACRAAAVLARLARPATTGWARWHARFLDRYGLRAVVPVRDAVDADVGLGYPAGFTGAAPAAPDVLTDRDRALVGLAQRAALCREQEIVLTDAVLAAVAGPTPVDDVQPATELTVRVHADSLAAITGGDFRLSVVRAGGHAFATMGRFLDLFDKTDRRRLADSAAATPQVVDGALRAQLSAVTRYTISHDVARVPHVLPHLIPVGEYHPDAATTIALDDLAVTADANRLYLISVSRGCVVQPMQLNAVERVRHTLPIVRFLAEASTAMATPCAPFDWGPVARDLPFLPALRHGRTLLSRARWLLPATELPDRAASWSRWDQALTRWMHTIGCPPAVCLGVGDQTLGLDLRESAHRVLLRDHLIRHGDATLRASPDGNGWIGGYPHEIVIPLTGTAPAPPPPRVTHHLVDVRTHGHPPGDPDHQYLKVYARPDRHTAILLDHLPALLALLPPEAGWWFQRFTGPEPHLRLRTQGLPIEAITAWTRRLVDADLTRRVQWDTDYPEPGRFGSPAAYTATTGVFTADCAAVLAQLAVTHHRQGPDWRALVAASMVDLTAAVLGDRHEAMRWLITHTRGHHPAPERAVYDQAIELANPHDHSALSTLPAGDDLLDRWEQRRRVLAEWSAALPGLGGATPMELLPDLLHLHHVRCAGADLTSERSCLHLARSAALSWTSRSPQ